jgi:hypothetical protein
LDLTTVSTSVIGILIGLALGDLLREKARPARLRNIALLVIFTGQLVEMLTDREQSAAGRDVGLAISAALLATGATIMVIRSRAARLFRR